MNKKPTPNMDALRASNGEKPLEEQAQGGDLAVLSADDVEAAKPPSDEQLKNVRDVAARLYKARRLVTKLLEEAKTTADEIEAIETKELPEAMRTIGMRRFELVGGFEIELEDVVHGNIKKDDKPKAFDWLREVTERAKNGWDAIIKNSITITFDKGDEKWADKFMRDLAKRKRPLQVEREATIHAGTLKKFVKERVAAEKKGDVAPELTLPRDLFGVFEFTRANLVDPAEEARKSAAKLEKPKKPKKEKGAASGEVEM